MRKKPSFEELVRENRNQILRDSQLLDKIDEKIDEKFNEKDA